LVNRTAYFFRASEEINKFPVIYGNGKLITVLIFYIFRVEGKDKAVPLEAWSGPEGSRKLSFPDFKTTAQDGGKVVSLTHRQPLPPGNAPGTHFC